MFEYLKDFDPHFSHRKFSKKAGFRTPSIITSVVKGRRGLSIVGAHKVAKAFELLEDEKAYFLKMVKIQKTKNAEVKSQLVNELLEHKLMADQRPIGPSEYQYFSNWQNVLIRELINAGAKTFAEIKRNLLPDITDEQIYASVKQLTELGLVELRDGDLISRHRYLNSNSDDSADYIIDFKEKMISKSIDALKKFPSSIKEMRCATFSLDSSLIPQLKQDINEAISKLAFEYEQRSIKKNAVFQLNIQAFPLTRLNVIGSKIQS